MKIQDCAANNYWWRTRVILGIAICLGFLGNPRASLAAESSTPAIPVEARILIQEWNNLNSDFNTKDKVYAAAYAKFLGAESAFQVALKKDPKGPATIALKQNLDILRGDVNKLFEEKTTILVQLNTLEIKISELIPQAGEDGPLGDRNFAQRLIDLDNGLFSPVREKDPPQPQIPLSSYRTEGRLPASSNVVDERSI